MGRTRAEQYEDRRRQIMEGALKAFSEKGFLQATNRDIARTAGIASPGLIYHYFADKEALLRAIIEEMAPPFQLVRRPAEVLAMPPRDGLLQFARAYVGLLESPIYPPLIRMVLGEAVHNAGFRHTFFEIGPMRVWGLLADFLRLHMQAGRLKRVDPGAAAQCFLGPLVLALLQYGVMQAPLDPTSSIDTLIDTHVDIFLNGLGAASEEAKP